MIVNYVRHVVQVEDGRHYIGRLKIDNSCFDYAMKFTYSIPQLSEMTMPEDTVGMRKLIKIEVVKKGAAIELTEREYEIFLTMLLDHVLQFYEDPRTREYQVGFWGILTRGMKLLGYQIKTTPGSTSKGWYDMPEYAQDILKQEKFGCKFVNVAG